MSGEQHHTSPTDGAQSDERPPLFASWRQWYLVILLELAVLIILFRIVTVVFG